MSPTKSVHGDLWVRRFGRAALAPFRSVSEVADAIEVRGRLQRASATGRRIVVDDLGTGADTAVVTALVARALAHHRHDRVLAVDATDRLPTLGARLGARTEHALGEGVETGSFELAEKSLGAAATGLWTVRAAQDDGGVHASGLLPISRFFGVTLVAGGSGGTFVDAVAETAHSRIRVVRATREAALEVGRRIDELLRYGRRDEVERSVVVVFDQEKREDPGFDAARVTRIIAESGAKVVLMPHDRHLAQGLAVDTRRIADVTHRAALRIAAEAVNSAVDVRPRPEGTEGRGEWV
ncbi:hypothetical protein GCM10007079_05960 [Nocardiopsis terrae]|uniref:MinD-like ATPase involved in chromosome partitioning or flagellar assembly n=1 Tax=Nocardiopsis terrae TaxID=372655 RepID=A0ABR9HNP8_9ACTN|nr:ATPase [Nocardiopsis terrae]MBE1460644.1 MinD-like ATPase involved in chromosome partitioning or flagellar assembly [Nocardiopsis terrae]GHC72618.1 hypothetical protein GCM10007079_05960 [Nocardiopsis terrae]